MDCEGANIHYTAAALISWANRPSAARWNLLEKRGKKFAA